VAGRETHHALHLSMCSPRWSRGDSNPGAGTVSKTPLRACRMISSRFCQLPSAASDRIQRPAVSHPFAWMRHARASPMFYGPRPIGR